MYLLNFLRRKIKLFLILLKTKVTNPKNLFQTFILFLTLKRLKIVKNKKVKYFFIFKINCYPF